MAPTTNTTTAHVLASDTTSIDKNQIEEEAVRVRDAATRSQKWRTLAILNLFKGACFSSASGDDERTNERTNDRRRSLIPTLDPLFDPPPTPDMTLIEPFNTTDFPTLLGLNIADPDTRPRKRRRLDNATLHHIIPDVRVFPFCFSYLSSSHLQPSPATHHTPTHHPPAPRPRSTYSNPALQIKPNQTAPTDLFC